VRLRDGGLTSFRSDFIWVSKRACFRKWTLKPVRGAISGVRLVPARKLPYGEIRGVRDRVASGSELQAVRAGSESGCLEVENVTASRTQRRIKAEIATGIRVTRRGRATGVAGRAGGLSDVQRHGGGGDVIPVGIAEVEFDGKRRAAGNRSCRTVQGVDPVGDIFGQGSSAGAEETAVAAVRCGDRMCSNCKGRGCERG